MKDERLKLPVGIEDFKKIRKNQFYYVDKTALIRDLLYDWGEVNLFTRPRRFGKSLNMSMFQAFFEIGCDKTLGGTVCEEIRENYCDSSERGRTESLPPA